MNFLSDKFAGIVPIVFLFFLFSHFCCILFFFVSSPDIQSYASVTDEYGALSAYNFCGWLDQWERHARLQTSQAQNLACFMSVGSKSCEPESQYSVEKMKIHSRLEFSPIDTTVQSLPASNMQNRQNPDEKFCIPTQQNLKKAGFGSADACRCVEVFVANYSIAFFSIRRCILRRRCYSLQVLGDP